MKDEEAMTATTQADLTLGDCLWLLAEAKKPCNHLRADGTRWWEKDGGLCYACVDTAGCVPRFRDAEGNALFRRPCGHAGGKIRGFCEPPCLGWEPLDEAEATIEVFLSAVRSQSWQAEVVQNERRSHVWIHQGIVNLSFVDCDAGLERLACYRAMVAAVQRKEAKS